MSKHFKVFLSAYFILLAIFIITNTFIVNFSDKGKLIILVLFLAAASIFRRVDENLKEKSS